MPAEHQIGRGHGGTGRFRVEVDADVSAVLEQKGVVESLVLGQQGVFIGQGLEQSEQTVLTALKQRVRVEHLSEKMSIHSGQFDEAERSPKLAYKTGQ